MNNVFYRILLVVIVSTITETFSLAYAQTTVSLWEENIPYTKGTGDGHEPTLTIYLPDEDKATGIGVVVCPGGGYGGLAVGHEGKDIARWLNSHGIAAFVLRYRHGPVYQHPVPLMDAQRALRMVRAKGSEWHAGRNVGIIGFSAGGHLASTTGTWHDAGEAAAADPIEHETCRPDFLILGYPVISMSDPHAHKGSRKNLLGENPDPKLVNKLSTHLQVTEYTPPTFLIHTTEDVVVPVQNSLMFYQALVEHGVPAELHVYEQGRHGLGMAPRDPAMSTWPDLCIEWLKKRGFLE